MGLISRRRNHAYADHPNRQFTSLESFNQDGLEVARRRNRSRGLPLRQIFLFLLAVVSFKIFLFFQMGASAYGTKVEALSNGPWLERVAAQAMTLDPVSEWIIDGVRFGSW